MVLIGGMERGDYNNADFLFNIEMTSRTQARVRMEP